VTGISPSQDTYPILAYNGPTIRAGYNFRLFSVFYLGADFYYKYLYYNNVTFFDSDGDWGDVTFTRNEKANVLGWHINTGIKINLSKKLYFNPSLGMGQTIKHRTYTTTNVIINPSPEEYVPVGTYTKDLKYFSMIFNLNFGIKLGK